MAIQTIPLSGTLDPLGLVWYEVDYDDATLLIRVIRAVNHSDQGPAGYPADSQGRIWLVNDPTRKWPADGSFHITQPNAGGTGIEELTLTNQQARRLQLTVSDHRGTMRVDNLDGEFSWLGNYAAIA